MSIRATFTSGQQHKARVHLDSAARQGVESVDFSPVDSAQRRPWDPDWHIYGLVRDRFINPTQHVLDFGCGIGLAALRFAHLGFQVDGFDMTPANIVKARELACRHALTQRCCFQAMPAEALGYPDDIFDIVVGLDVLHAVNLGRALAEAHRVLRPGGVAYFKCHVTAPVLDPQGKSPVARRRSVLDQHQPTRARMLNQEELNLVHNQFASVTQERFTILSRLDHVLPGCDQHTRGRLERLDERLLRACSSMVQLGGTVVLTCYKRDIT